MSGLDGLGWPTDTPSVTRDESESDGADCSPLAREEMEEARALVLECARKHGEIDAKEGVAIPPAEFCEETKVSKMLRAAWLQGWRSANGHSADTAGDGAKDS